MLRCLIHDLYLDIRKQHPWKRGIYVYTEGGGGGGRTSSMPRKIPQDRKSFLVKDLKNRLAV